MSCNEEIRFVCRKLLLAMYTECFKCLMNVSLSLNLPLISSTVSLYTDSLSVCSRTDSLCKAIN